jgi:hypothetical protein
MGGRDDPANSGHRLKEPSTGQWRSISYVGGSYRIPVPPGTRVEPSKAEREQEARAKERGDAQVARLHLVRLFSVGVVVGALALVAVVVMFVVVLIGH